ncbi:MAG: YraN family protein [Zoogloeaceae bacterium]|jgi:putative endonuclease|nr:YraN family protein [Zoogloeaceae bacterium]
MTKKMEREGAGNWRDWFCGLVKRNHTTATTDGARAEALAREFLEARGLRIVARNFRVRGGEIDLIAQEGEILVFVEVRLRRSEQYGGAAASVTARKRRRIILAAQHWRKQQRQTQAICRFDCVLLDSLEKSAIRWLRHAFTTNS